MTQTPRRTVLTAAAFAAVTAATAASAAAAVPGRRDAAEPDPAQAPTDALTVAASTIAYHAWTSASDWRSGTGRGTALVSGDRSGVLLRRSQGTVDYTDPHTGNTSAWEHATWLSPEHRVRTPGSELIASWNADTPAGTFVRIEVRATYTDGTESPWYTLGVWASGDEDLRRTSLDGQRDGKSSVWTDTVAVDDTDGPLRIAGYRLRLTLHRKPGLTVSPVVWRVGAMVSDVPDRFEVPASTPGVAAGTELPVPPHSQNIHIGRYPEYNGGGQAWCSPTSATMILAYWGKGPGADDLAWVNPAYDDPQVCHAARFTFDYEYEGCGNWPFNTAYAASYPDMQGVVTRIASLADAETLIAAGIPLITSQSFYEAELDGSGYGTAGHLMTVVGFTADGDVIANDPASPSNAAVRRVYKRRQFENILLRTRRLDAGGVERGGSGGVVYLFFPARPTAAQRRALAAVGVR
ncbi:peptidase C39 family protein [Streptomyces xiamenensis]